MPRSAQLRDGTLRAGRPTTSHLLTVFAALFGPIRDAR
jgi:hypothetical protein